MRKVEGVMLVPATPNSILKLKRQEMEQKGGLVNKCKYVETARKTIQNMLVKIEPWGDPCGREDSSLCQNQPGRFTQKNVLYRFDCGICEKMEPPIKSFYYGGSARSMYERAREHRKAIMTTDKSLPWWNTKQNTIQANQLMSSCK